VSECGVYPCPLFWLCVVFWWMGCLYCWLFNVDEIRDCTKGL